MGGERHVHVSAFCLQRPEIFLELELEVVVSCLMWVVGTELGSSLPLSHLSSPYSVV